MAKYTIELRSLFEPYRINPPLYTLQEVENVFKDYELTDFLTQQQISVITTAGIWSKDKLATQIVDHYYMRELGFETPALFFHYAKVTMKELMEEYLPLIYSASIEYDPLVNVDFTETLSRQTSGLSTGSNTGSSNSNSSSNSSGLTINSDTPQGRVNKTNILAGLTTFGLAASNFTGTRGGGIDDPNVALVDNLKVDFAPAAMMIIVR